jgi:hypothetical protein
MACILRVEAGKSNTSTAAILISEHPAGHDFPNPLNPREQQLGDLEGVRSSENDLRGYQVLIHFSR